MPVLALFVPSAAQCLTLAGPMAGIFGLVWLARHGQELVEGLFPHWRWERQLGWLNLRAHRRAESALRWIGHFVHAGLAVTLLGIVWNAYLVGEFNRWDDTVSVGFLLLHLSILLACLAICIVYLATILAPKIRNEYEREELERFRRENPDQKETKQDVHRSVTGGITIWESPLNSSPRRR
jgi:hypothetical protein